MLKPWPHVSTERIVETRVFSLERRRSNSPRTGLDCDFYVLDAPHWINVVPITGKGKPGDDEPGDRELVLVRQYRHGVRDFTLEIPGGMMEPDDASPLVAARRELMEETGYEAGRFHEVGWVQPNPAIQSNRCYTFLAEELRQVAPIDPDGSEDLEVVRIPVREIGAYVTSGKIRHSLVIAALALTFGLGGMVR